MEANIPLYITPEADAAAAETLHAEFPCTDAPEGLHLRLDGAGLTLVSEGQELRGDFTRLLPRLKAGRLNGELLVKAAKIKTADGPLTALDATAGLGEDSMLLAAAGFRVTLCERNGVVFALLRDAHARALREPELAEIAGRMALRRGDSVEIMAEPGQSPDVILLDPMFPARQKSALVKKKLQMIQKLETPCADEGTLLRAAMEAGPKKLIVKRPPKGPWLADVKPDHSIEGKAVRYDVFASPKERVDKFKWE